MLSSVQGCIHYPCSGMACAQMRYANAAAYVLQASLKFCCWQLEWHELYVYGTALDWNRSIFRNCDHHLNLFSRIWHSEDRASWYIPTSIIKPTRCINSHIYFWNRTLHVSDRFSVHHQESSTVHTATGICHTGYADCLLASSQHNLYDINLLLCVQC